MPEDEACDVVDLSDIRVRIADNDILRDVSLRVPSGEIVALMGPSGCGKTTLLRVITGATAATGIRRVNAKYGVVYQDLKLLPWLSVMDNILLASGSADDSIADARALLYSVGLEEKEHVFPYELSGGERQRVALVRALAGGTKFLLMDEPFSALDFVVRHRLVEQVERLVRGKGISLLFVTHTLEDALALADRILVMKQGQIVGEFANDRRYPDAAELTRDSIVRLFEEGSAQ